MRYLCTDVIDGKNMVLVFFSLVQIVTGCYSLKMQKMLKTRFQISRTDASVFLIQWSLDGNVHGKLVKTVQMIASWSFPYCDLWMLVPTDLTPVLALHICRANTGVRSVWTSGHRSQ